MRQGAGEEVIRGACVRVCARARECLLRIFSMFLGLATGSFLAFNLVRGIQCQTIKYAKPGYERWKKVLKI